MDASISRLKIRVHLMVVRVAKIFLGSHLNFYTILFKVRELFMARVVVFLGFRDFNKGQTLFAISR